MLRNIMLLIKKDKLIFSTNQGYLILYSVVVVALMTVVGLISMMPSIMGIVFFSSALCSSIVQDEEQSKCSIMAFTLPVNLKHYLIARYIYCIIYPIKILLVCSLVGISISYLAILDARNISTLINYVNGFLFAVPLGFIAPAFIIPLYHFIGANKSRIVFFVLFFIVIYTVNYTVFQYLTAIKHIMFAIPMIMLFIALIFYYISYRISLKILSTARLP